MKHSLFSIYEKIQRNVFFYVKVLPKFGDFSLFISLTLLQLSSGYIRLCLCPFSYQSNVFL